MRTTKIDEKKMENHVIHWIAQEFAKELEKNGYNDLAIKFKGVTLKNARVDFRAVYLAYRADLADRADRAYLAYLAYRYLAYRYLAYLADRVYRVYRVDRVDLYRELVNEYIEAYIYAGGRKTALKVAKLNTKILKGIETEKFFLQQETWHGENSCGTTHCRGGYTTTLAGDVGRELEELVGNPMAPAMIAFVSTGSIPNYYDMDNDAVLDDIKACAAKE